jgi:hypothetical protein
VGDSPNSNEASVTTPAPNPAPNPAPQTVTYLSDLAWVSATNGWGPVERDMSVGGSGAGDGTTLTLNGVTYAKGLGVHAPSEIVYNLGGTYAQFTSDIGIDDRQTTSGSVVFQVFADGVKRYDSGVMTPASATKTITLDMTGVQQLKLVVTDAGDGIDYDHADWAGARLLTSSTPAPTPAPTPPPPTATIPLAPSNLVATAMTSTKIALSWADNSSDESGFYVYRSTDGITWNLVSTLAANTTTWTSTGLAKGARYYYKVTAFNAAGESAATNISSATTPKR